MPDGAQGVADGLNSGLEALSLSSLLGAQHVRGKPKIAEGSAKGSAGGVSTGAPSIRRKKKIGGAAAGHLRFQ
eukprot:4752264-Alexandrium_andersonii.AAC.1